MKPLDETKPYESRLMEDLHPDLVLVSKEADIEWDKQFPDGPNVFTTCTYRNNARQNELFAQKKPRVTWAKGGESPHNTYPSSAWDIAFFDSETKKLDWSAHLFDAYAKIFKDIAAKHGIRVTWGADWNRDNIKDKIKQDAPHFELTNWRQLI